jgi:hypothetical protein
MVAPFSGIAADGALSPRAAPSMGRVAIAVLPAVSAKRRETPAPLPGGRGCDLSRMVRSFGKGRVAAGEP